MRKVPEEIEKLATKTIGAAIEVHKGLGPGFRETTYRQAMEIELGLRKLPFQSECDINVNYKGNQLGAGRVDLLIDDLLLVELKAVEKVLPVHRSQLIHYLKATKRPLGLLLNFNVVKMKQGISRVVMTKNHPRAKWSKK